MVRLLPFILVPVLIIAGLGYWRFVASVPKATTELSQASRESAQDASGSVEVPKTLPQASLEDRVTSLEDIIAKLAAQVNNLKPGGSQAVNSSDSRLKDTETAISDLKARVSALERGTPISTGTSSRSALYIPLGGTGGPWTNTDWVSLSEYEVSLDPASYPGYSGMSLEVNFRLVDPAGTGSVRLYNVTDAGAVSSQLDTSSTSFSLKTSTSFKLASGQKTYRLQIKSVGGKDLYIQSARIKVSF